MALPSWLPGRSLRQSTPWRGASLPSGARERDRICLEERQDPRPESVCAASTLLGFLGDDHRDSRP